MKPQASFVAERMVARHSDLLLPAAPAEADLLTGMDELAKRLGRALPLRLAGLAGGERPAVQVGPVRKVELADLSGNGSLAMHCLFAAGPQAAPIAVTMEGAAVFCLIDRAFGGVGSAPDPLPTAFPLSAELMISRLEGTIAQALGDALAAPATPLRRHENMVRLGAFAFDEPLAAIDVTVIDGEASWQLTVALPLAGVGAAASPAGATQAASRAALAAPEAPASETPAPESDALSGPFGDVPLTLRAVLVDMAIPFSTLAALAPGQIVPVAVARTVPLIAGDHVVAAGTVGAMDDRVAIRVAAQL